MMDTEKIDNNLGLDCILCAAGRSSRMGDWKPLLPWKGGALIDAAVGAALQAGCRIILVTGHRGDELAARFGGTPGIVLAHNPDWESGMVSSIRCGLARVATDRFFVAHGDMPMILPSTYADLARRSRAADAAPASAPVPRAWRPLHQGRPGHPVLFDSSARPYILDCPSRDSLKPALSRCAVDAFECADPGTVLDLDDPETYLRRLTHAGAAAGAVPVLGRPSLLPPEPLVLTGPKGSGKTTALRHLFYRAVEVGMPSCLISQVQTERDDSDRALGFDMELLSFTGPGDAGRSLSADSVRYQRIPLARSSAADNWPPPADRLDLGPFAFDGSVFRRAHAFLEDFLSDPAIRQARRPLFLGIDEIGKLELLRGEGLLPSLTLLLGRSRNLSGEEHIRVACSSRLDLLEKFTELWIGAEYGAMGGVGAGKKNRPRIIQLDDSGQSPEESIDKILREYL